MSINNLRMPRVHELHVSPEKKMRNLSSTVSEKEQEGLQCSNCKSQMNFDAFPMELQSVPNKDVLLCYMCSIDILADEIVNKVLKTLYSNELETIEDDSFIFESLKNHDKKICETDMQKSSEQTNFSCEESRGRNEIQKSEYRSEVCSSREDGPSEKVKENVKQMDFMKIGSISNNTDIVMNPSLSSYDSGSVWSNQNSTIDSLADSQNDIVDHIVAFTQENCEVVPIHYGKKVSDFYQDEKLLGKGKFGKVSRMTHKMTNVFRAVKIIIYNNEEVKKDILNEIRILECLVGNEHVMELIEVIDDNQSRPNTMNLVTEYLQGGELFEQIAQDELLTEEQVIDIMCQILDGVSFIHDRGIIHRDLKPENLVYTSKDNGHLKIIDFGFAVKYDPQTPPKSMVGTTIFVAPEVLQFENQSYLTDMWSVGVIAYNLLAGITPFEIPLTGDPMRNLSDHEIIENIERCQYNFDDEGFIGVSQDAKNFISSLLIRDPSERLTARECLKHEWVSSCYKNKSKSLARSISLKRMKNYVAIKNWQKVCTIFQTISCFKNSILSTSSS